MIESETLIEFTESYFKALNLHKSDLIKDLWHPEGVLLINYEKRPLEFIYKIPPFVRFDLKIIHVLSIDAEIGTVKTNWEMVMGEERGIHHTYLTVIFQDEKLKILSQVDFGSMD